MFFISSYYLNVMICCFFYINNALKAAFKESIPNGILHGIKIIGLLFL